jgi:hypothetical protein
MVHDYSHYYDEESTALGASGARVEVYTNSGLVQTFLVSSEPGTLWTVFEITGGTTLDPIITAINTVTSESPFAGGLTAEALATDAVIVGRAVRAHPKAGRAERSVPPR